MTQSTTATTRAYQGPSPEQVDALLTDLSVSPDTDLIGLLQDVQDHSGYLPEQTLAEISRRTRTPLSRIYGVVSFYAQFYTEPRGRHTIRCCRGTACHVRDGKKIIQSVERTLGIEEGQTTGDMLFSFETVACLGACALAPVVVIDDTYYGSTTPQRITKAINRIVADDAADQETN